MNFNNEKGEEAYNKGFKEGLIMGNEDNMKFVQEKIDEEIRKYVKIFGISLAGQYRNQGMLEFAQSLIQSLGLTEEKT